MKITLKADSVLLEVSREQAELISSALLFFSGEHEPSGYEQAEARSISELLDAAKRGDEIQNAADHRTPAATVLAVSR